MGGSLSGLTGTIGSITSPALSSIGNSISGSSVANSLGSAFGPLVGASGGVNGTGRPAPAAANIQQGVTTGQTGQAYSGAQNSLASQQALLAALQSQNGLGAQTSALGQQQALSSQLAGAGGVQNQSQALASQQGLAAQQQATARQYQQIASGQGPNPAMAQLNQTTGQNIAAQNALMAGQRGASSNVGLLARQAAQQGAATQQQAVGQGATMAAQQELGALSGLSAQQQAIGSTQQNVANIAAQQVGQQQSQQQALAGQANTIAGQQIGATTANTQAQQSEQQLLQNALAQYNQQQVSSQGSVNAANAGLANTSIQGQQALLGGVTNSVGGGLGSVLGGSSGAGAAAAGARGGMVKKPKKMASGGSTDDTNEIDNPTASSAPNVTSSAVSVPTPQNIQGPQSTFGQFLKGALPNGQQSQQGMFNLTSGSNPGAQALQKGFGSFGPALASAFNSSPSPQQQQYAGPDMANDSSTAMSARGGMAKNKHDYRAGGNVKAKDPKEKAVKKGNSYSNDKIPAMLSEGEVVIPRSIMQGKDPVRGSADFVAKLLAKRMRKSA